MTFDFAIIGGGIAGVSAASRLAQIGSVVVLEAEDALSFHASGRSAATFEPDYGAPATVALNRASHAELHALGVLGPLGVMVLAGPGEEGAFDADCTAFSLHEISPAEARARVPALDPDAILRAAVSASAEDFDTDAFLQHHARNARAAGARIMTRAPVTAMVRTGGRWQLTTSQGTVEAGHVVNAAGAWADRVAEMAGVAPLGLQPFRRSMARIPAPAGMDVSDWPMLIGAGESWYAKRDAGALIVSPADADPVDPHDAFADDMVLAEGLARYEARVTTPVTRMLANWAGLRTYTPDRTLAIGPDRRVPSFLWLAGQGGQGFQTAAAASRLLADRVAGRAPDLPADIVAALDPGRFA